MYRQIIQVVLLTALFSDTWLFAKTGFAQETKTAEDAPASVVKGRLVQNEKKSFEINFADLKTTFHQMPNLPQPPVPDTWSEMKNEDRRKWITEFETSDKGKAFVAERKKLMDAAARFELNVEDNGNFVIYDVPAGTYGLRGRVEKTVDEKNYVMEVYGQVLVSEAVEEVLLDPIMVNATRVLKSGDPVPDFEVITFDGKRKIQTGLLQGRNVLLSFWALESPPSLEFAKTVQETYAALSKSHELQLLSICIDSDKEKALDYIKVNKVYGWHGYADNWEHDIVSEFGVRVIPALYLINREGTVLMTHFDFRQAFQVEDAKLDKIVVDAIDGKNIPTIKQSDPEITSPQPNDK